MNLNPYIYINGHPMLNLKAGKINGFGLEGSEICDYQYEFIRKAWETANRSLRIEFRARFYELDNETGEYVED